MTRLDLSGWAGKTIQKVTQTGPEMEAEAAICILTFTDGTRTRLHANDLGEWKTELPPEGVPYQSWGQLMQEYGAGISEEPLIEVLPGVLRFTRVSDGRTFNLDLEAPSVKGWHWTEKVLTHPRGLELLAEAAACAPFWRICFNQNSVRNGDTPEELLLVPEDVAPEN